jgi:hypothetical protein
MRAVLIGAAFLLSGCGDASPPQKANDENLVTINTKYWVCTSTHVSHHDAVEMGIKIRRQFPAYDKTECDQWSATFVKPWPSCPDKNVWCQGTKQTSAAR